MDLDEEMDPLTLQNLRTVRHETKTLNEHTIKNQHTDQVNVICKYLEEEHEYLGDKVFGNKYFIDDHINTGYESFGL